MHTNEKYNYSELTSKIIGCAMEVHKNFGNGFQEVVYQRALDIEFRLQNIGTQREFVMPLVYKGEDIGTRRVDFFVEGKVMVEIKAIMKSIKSKFGQLAGKAGGLQREIQLKR